MSKETSNKVILVTGASSGIGCDTVLRLLKSGYTVYGAARRTELMKEIETNGGHSIFLDLTDENSIEQCVQKIIEKEGRIDILVNNAGYGLGGPIETIPIQEGRKQFDVNLFGMARLIQLVLPYMRNNHYGKIINVGSVSGKIATPYVGWYTATKFALEGFTDALRNEVRQFGIKVILIEPGSIKTDWGLITEKNIKKYSENTVYENETNIISGFFSKYYQNDKIKDNTYLVSKAIETSIRSRNPKTRYVTDIVSKTELTLRKFVTDRLLDNIIKIIYR